MKQLKLCNSELIGIVDDDIYDELIKVTWRLGTNRRIIHNYSIPAEGYANGRRTIYVALPNKIMGGTYTVYDHIDRNPLNNLRVNLRLCTYSQNGINRGKQKGYVTSPYKGVSWDRINKKWRANIKIGKLRMSIGRYLTQEEAALAYNTKAKDYYGEFAVLNVLPQLETTIIK